MDEKLKFTIRRYERDIKSISASVVSNSDKPIYITKHIKGLFNFTKEFAKNNDIYFEKYRKRNNKKVIDTLLFDEAELILSTYEEYYKKNVRNTIVAISSAVGVVGATGVINSKVNADSYSDEDKVIEVNDNIINSNVIGNNLMDDIVEEVKNNKIIPDITFENTDVFQFDYEDRSLNEEVNNSRRYMDCFEEVGTTYGIDPNLLMAIMAQESSGIHHEYSQNGYATGGMQIENFWFGKEITAYNFKLGQLETIKVDENMVSDLNYNIKVSSMILQNHLEYYNYNIPIAVQAYNYGDANMKKLGDDWINDRKYIDSGDPKYFEHIFSFLPNNYTLKMLKPNGNSISLTLNNISNNKSRGK